jgi:hypothetical protein
VFQSRQANSSGSVCLLSSRACFVPTLDVSYTCFRICEQFSHRAPVDDVSLPDLPLRFILPGTSSTGFPITGAGTFSIPNVSFILMRPFQSPDVCSSLSRFAKSLHTKPRGMILASQTPRPSTSPRLKPSRCLSHRPQDTLRFQASRTTNSTGPEASHSAGIG